MAVELPLYLQADGQYESLYVNGYGHHIRVESPP